MNSEETIEMVGKAMVILLLIFIFFLPIRISYISFDYNDLCQYKYGEKYVFEKDGSFGTYCIELVHENLTKINPKPYDWNLKEAKEICKSPGFFDLSRWDNGVCNDAYAVEGGQ